MLLRSLVSFISKKLVNRKTINKDEPFKRTRVKDDQAKKDAYVMYECERMTDITNNLKYKWKEDAIFACHVDEDESTAFAEMGPLIIAEGSTN